jgi:hypothetical protein
MFVSHANRLRPHSRCRVDLTMFSLWEKCSLQRKTENGVWRGTARFAPPVGIRHTHTASSCTDNVFRLIFVYLWAGRAVSIPARGGGGAFMSFPRCARVVKKD